MAKLAKNILWIVLLCHSLRALFSDPFDQTLNLCRSVGSNGFQFFAAQLRAGYAYFGVPRLTTGRHVFTRIRAHDSSSQCSLSETQLIAQKPVSNRKLSLTSNDDLGRDQNQHGAENESHSPRKQNEADFVPRIYFTPIIDGSNDFEDNLVKVSPNKLFVLQSV